MKLACILLLLIQIVGCSILDQPRKSNEIEVSFSLDGINEVIFRSSDALNSSVVVSDELKGIEVVAQAVGGAEGYHSSDPNWKETSASKWDMTFVSAKFSDVLVISSKNEIQYIHHGYFLRNISISIPGNVSVVKESREITGDGAPDLSAP